MKAKAVNRNIEQLRDYSDVHRIDTNITSVNDMTLWTKSDR